MWDVLLQTSSSVALLGALAVLLLVFFLSSASFSSQEGGKEPPGPRPLPLIGNLLQLDLKKPYRSLEELSKKYGPVFTVYMGRKKVVMLVGYKTVKEALVNHSDDFGERQPSTTVKDTNLDHGVVWGNGESWKEMRRFALINLRDFGMGKRVCEDKIIEECQHLLKALKKFKGEAFDTTEIVNHAVSNIICTMVYGSRFEYDNPVFRSMVTRVNRYLELLGSPGVQLYNVFSFIGQKLFPIRQELGGVIAASKKQNIELVNHLKGTLNPQTPRGFVDAFLIRQQQEEESRVSGHFNNENLITTVLNLFTAGTETTATTLRWGFLLLAKHPKIQDQVQEELRRVMGGRQVQMEDRKNLPFTDAVIHETQRVANIVPMSLPHRTSRDVTFRGYFIEKGTTIYPVLSSVLNDESEWEEPHSFHPAHFLNKDGKFVKRDAFMPFSAGRRVCLGESLARMELFLFFSTLLQHFRFTPPPGVSEDDLDLTPCMGISLTPSPHKLCAVPCM